MNKYMSVEKKHKPSMFVEECKVDYRKRINQNDSDVINDIKMEIKQNRRFLQEY